MITHYFASHRGGIEIVAGNVYEKLSKAGEQVVWLASSATAPPPPEGKSYSVPLRAYNFVEERTGVPFPIPTRRAMGDLAKEISAADVVMLHDCLYLTNMAGFLLAKLRRKPIVIVQHIGIVPYRNLMLRMLMKLGTAIFTRTMLSRADQVVFIGENTRAHFCSLRYRSSPEVIFNGVETATYKPINSDLRRDARRQFGLPEGGRVALFVGRFVEKKGLSILQRMARANTSIIWALAGWGPIDPRGWNLPNVRVFSGLHGDSLAMLYGASDVFVLPSKGEGLPLVIQEALASGLGVVCGIETLGADPEMNHYGKGVPITDDEEKTASEFLKAIEDLLAQSCDTEIVERRSFAKSRYSWEKAAKQYIAIAAKLTSRPA